MKGHYLGSYQIILCRKERETILRSDVLYESRIRCERKVFVRTGYACQVHKLLQEVLLELSSISLKMAHGHMMLNC